ncbi:multiple sugar transport system substrate-binding protein [Paenibacillus sp. 1_12]|uniref:ABC transporter substrate-binding protein n=1 Tax=Paenibacillus sp. 1_12 TaxID=1566278 RepID=UPI0008E2D866|nr:extracellular solute-binding protein [Paenibacillus sp. 1_12]SFK80937.1 multiple sugar transport system substrate-binding protein [Paenibacillus sp. 1_12]
MKKQSMVVLSGVIAAVAVLSGCGAQDSKENTSGQGKASVTLKYYNYDTDVLSAATKKQIEKYESMNPNIKIEPITLVPGNASDTLRKLDITMSSGEQVDVVKMPSIEEVMARSALGVLAPLDELYAKDNIKPEEEYYVNPKYQGKYYASMITSNNWFVLLNEDALKEANLPVPGFDWTWDDYREYAKKLTKGDRYGTYFHSWGEYTNPIAYTDKPNPYVKEDLKPLFDDASFKYFFDLRRVMEKEDKSAKPLADVIGAKLNYRNEFFTGKAAMLMSANFMLSDVSNVEKYPHTFKTVFAPLPRSSKQVEPGLTNIGGDYLAIANGSKNKDEAYKFIRYMTTVQDGRIDMSGWKKGDSKALIESLYGSNKNLVDVESLNAVLSDKRIKTAISGDIAIPYGSQLKKVMEDGFSKFMLDNTSAEDAQKWMVQQADKIIQQNKK